MDPQSGESPIVSSEDEELILVDSDDREVGFATKARCHDGDGMLHRAFSVFLFNPNGELLLQQRSSAKRLWPGYWTNSCCSHPRRGEQTETAAQRRIAEELGVMTELELLFKFEYQARFREEGAEHELCYVLIGRLEHPATPNINEVRALRLVSPAELSDALDADPTLYTPWLRREWPRILTDHWDRVTALVAP